MVLEKRRNTLYGWPVFRLKKKMKFTKFGVIIVIFIVFLSVFIAKVSNIITVNVDTHSSFSSRKTNSSLDNTIVKDNLDNLIWFVQISDLHISIFHDMSRITEFQEFCDITIDAIMPAVVLASGDLTDAKHANNIGSKQFEDEWKHYKNTLDKFKISEKTTWLDVRGNHDNFNVPGPISKENYFRSYSVQGIKNPKSYIHQITDKNGNLYSFIALDACLDPGPRRPFNFMGILTETEISNVRKLAEIASPSNSTIWFGHYPTSCILSPNRNGGVRSLIGDGGTAYLCGHLHTLGGFVKNMYTLQKSGFLELELGDWKENRRYRVAAIDHGLFSFTDLRHGEWPVVLVTNPKHALFTVPSKEPLHRVETSTHIRILAFSINNIASVQIRLQGGNWIECSHSQGPLYTSPWNPKLYVNGLNYLEVVVRDVFGREKKVIHPFALDGTRPRFAVMPRLILMSDLNSLFQILFGLAVIGCILPLCIVRCLNSAVKVRRIIRPGISYLIVQKIIRKLWILSSIDIFFYSLVLYPLYISVGPWTVGEIIENHVGIIFVWGTVINGSFLPGSFTYAYGFAQLVIFQFPLILYLSHHLDRRLNGRSHLHNSNKALIFMNYLWKIFPFIIIISVQVLFTYSFWLEYGGMAVLLGPLRLWSIFYALWLIYFAHVIPEVAIRSAASLLYSATPVTVTVTPCTEDEGISGNELKLSSFDINANNEDEVGKDQHESGISDRNSTVTTMESLPELLI
ncbi:transmembrane protein 62-like isoform X2 [Lycorma delicatula]|uniref:transmembrane protein 62-like isoform X2 n=1 Tax=Lycorma delicatula TaxID=130591 RepID=UPI003F511FF2